MANNAVTKEEKLKDIQEAEELYRQANDLIKKADKLITRGVRGLQLCSKADGIIIGNDYQHQSYIGKVEIHVYSGLLKLEKILGIKTEPEKDWAGRSDGSKKSTINRWGKVFPDRESHTKQI